MRYISRRAKLPFSTAVVMVLVCLAPVSPVGAAGPVLGTGGEPPGDSTVLPLTPEQAASVKLKEDLLRGLGGQDRTSGGLSADFVCQFDPCEPASLALNVFARQQTKRIYCGPSVVQVVSNFTWGKTGAQDKYSQQFISDQWTHTDANQQTYLGDEIVGMNSASVKPSGFVYAQKHNPTFETWHGTIIEDTFWWRMPLAAGVIPWKAGATYHLVSWKLVSNGGHYIELHGYVGRVTDASRYVWFSDVAGQYANSVAANYQQASYAVYETMVYNNQNMIW